MSEENIEIGWSDFLGNPIQGDIEWLPFEEAREFTRSLGLKSGKEWKSYHKENRPEGIPAAPNQVYKDKGWKGMGDFLGTGNKRGGWLPFEEARDFAKGLNLKSAAEWKSYPKNDKPESIPKNPQVYYKDQGWNGWGDFLGTGNKSAYEWLPFEEARAFARSLSLKSSKEWREYCNTGKKPHNIPSNVNQVYKDKGWTNWGDFLGHDRKVGGWLPLGEARVFVGSLNLKSGAEWRLYYKENKPDGLPCNPDQVYKDKGWKGYGDFLGTGNTRKGDWLPFKEARDFARSLNLTSASGWRLYHKENRPEGIPATPDKTYKDKGWNGWGDFLGTGNKSTYEWLPFEEARSFARSLNLKSAREWEKYHKDNKPKRIPSNPNSTYKDKGWTNWKDFLGN